MQLQNMCKKGNESFKEYTQKWRDLAAQVAPPMMEREMITMIVDTMSVFCYEKMIHYMPSSFAYLVFAGERIEMGLRRGKFDYAATTSSSNRRLGMNGGNKKEGETHVVTVVPTWPNFPLAPFKSHVPISFPTISILSQYQSFLLLTTLPTKNAQSSTKATPKLATKSNCCTYKTKHHPEYQSKYQPGKELSRKEAYRIHPNSNVVCWLTPVSAQ